MPGFNDFTHLKTQLMAEQFRQKGHEAGKSEGSLGTMRRSVLGALEIRHGAVPPELPARVQAVNSRETLAPFHEAAFVSVRWPILKNNSHRQTPPTSKTLPPFAFPPQMGDSVKRRVGVPLFWQSHYKMNPRLNKTPAATLSIGT